MTKPHPLADPRAGQAIQLELQTYAPAAPRDHAEIAAQLDRYDIATVLKPSYEWGGFRYSNASDAIAAARRGAIVKEGRA
jgi:hypothetical protein